MRRFIGVDTARSFFSEGFCSMFSQARLFDGIDFKICPLLHVVAVLVGRSFKMSLKFLVEEKVSGVFKTSNL